VAQGAGVAGDLLIQQEEPQVEVGAVGADLRRVWPADDADGSGRGPGGHELDWLTGNPRYREICAVGSPRSSGTGPASRVNSMSPHAPFTLDEARAAGERIGIDWDASPFGIEQFRIGMDVELEHGTSDPETNVTDDDVIVTAKIARAHLNEFPDYYTRLAKMEAEAKASRAAPGQ